MATAKLRALWNHPAGLKTVFFWAPTMKWGLVVAGLSDMRRPVENVSVPQCTALALTGLIWTKYSFEIVPINYNLAGANVFVALTNLYQLSRIALSSSSSSKEPAKSNEAVKPSKSD